MSTKEEYINTIIQEIFELDEIAIDKSRRQELYDFITRTINGDMPEKHFIINLDEEVFVYILTNLRIIKIDINDKKIQSSIFAIADIKEIEMIKLVKEERMQSKVIFSNNTMGLIYPIDDNKALEFFQAIDNLRVKRT